MFNVYFNKITKFTFYIIECVQIELYLKHWNILFWYSFQIAMRLGVKSSDVSKVIIWGNHSSTQYPDVQHGFVMLNGQAVPITEAVKDDNWIQGEFLKV